MSSRHQTNLLFLSISSAFCMAGKMDSDVAEELGSSAIAVSSNRRRRPRCEPRHRGGFPSAALHRLLVIIRAEYSVTKSSGDRVSHTKTSWRGARLRASRTMRCVAHPLRRGENSTPQSLTQKAANEIGLCGEARHARP